MEIKYKIEILSNWHIGSGLDSGANADAVVLKDNNGLPYIPGKTIKGLLRDSLIEIADVNQADKKITDELFGGKNENDNKTFAGNAYFSDAVLNEEQQKEIVSNGLQKFLYKNVASTSIGKNGIAKKASLRTMEITIPLSLEGSIKINSGNNKVKEALEKAFKWTRYIGVNRNRGLGRCKFIIEKK